MLHFSLKLLNDNNVEIPSYFAKIHCNLDLDINNFGKSVLEFIQLYTNLLDIQGTTNNYSIAALKSQNTLILNRDLLTTDCNEKTFTCINNSNYGIYNLSSLTNIAPKLHQQIDISEALTAAATNQFWLGESKNKTSAQIENTFSWEKLLKSCNTLRNLKESYLSKFKLSLLRKSNNTKEKNIFNIDRLRYFNDSYFAKHLKLSKEIAKL